MIFDNFKAELIYPMFCKMVYYSNNCIDHFQCFILNLKQIIFEGRKPIIHNAVMLDAITCQHRRGARYVDTAPPQLRPGAVKLQSIAGKRVCHLHWWAHASHDTRAISGHDPQQSCPPSLRCCGRAGDKMPLESNEMCANYYYCRHRKYFPRQR